MTSITKQNIPIHFKSLQLLYGNYASAFAGEGFDFHQLREYTNGDRPATIDWLATQRTGEVQVREYIETKRHSVAFFVDTSPGMQFPFSASQSKYSVIKELILLISKLAHAQGDRVNLLHSAMGPIRFSLPKGYATEALLDDQLGWMASTFQPHNTSGIFTLLENTWIARHRGAIFIFSEVTNISDEWLRKIALLREKNMVFLLTFDHYLSDAFRFASNIKYTDTYDLSQKQKNLDKSTTIKDIKDQYRRYCDELQKNIATTAQATGIHYVHCTAETRSEYFLYALLLSAKKNRGR